jgi:hypothetical protein
MVFVRISPAVSSGQCKQIPKYTGKINSNIQGMRFNDFLFGEQPD